MSVHWPTKDPDDVLDFTADFGEYLSDGETLSSKTVTVDTGLTKDSDAFDSTSTMVVVWLSGGSAGEVYNVEIEVGTSASRTINRTIKIAVNEL